MAQLYGMSPTMEDSLHLHPQGGAQFMSLAMEIAEGELEGTCGIYCSCSLLCHILPTTQEGLFAQIRTVTEGKLRQIAQKDLPKVSQRHD